MPDRYRCGNCESVYRTALERCPRCGGPEPTAVVDPVGAAGEADGVTGPAGSVGEPAGPVRPIVNAAKDEHAAYAAAVYGNTPEWWDAGYSKRGLIDTLNRLEAGTQVMEDGAVVDVFPDDHSV